MTESRKQDKRRFSRAPFDGVARLETGNDRFRVELADLSLKGARVLLPGDVDLALGSDCRLTLELDDSDLTIPMPAIVSHQQGGRAGLEFKPVDVEVMQHLRRLVELNLEDDAPLGRFEDQP